MTKRILFVTFGSLGDLYPYLALASEMQRRGHHATILYEFAPSLADRAERRAISAGGARSGFHRQDVSGARHEGGDGWPLLAAGRDSSSNPRELRQSAWTRRLEADLLVTQMLVYAGPLVVEKTGIPWVSTVLGPLSFFSYRDSPVLAARLAGLREAAPGLNALINRVARSTTQSWNQPVYQFRRELGLAQRRAHLRRPAFSLHGARAVFSRLAGPGPDRLAEAYTDQRLSVLGRGRRAPVRFRRN